ncbi:MAG TPA: hypothetical protein VLH15_01545 [Dehalococcoidales bacterium]|nr:hypothetical protein [Dehalococcoidales bacterium]
MQKQYIRPVLGQEVSAPAGYYLPVKEEFIQINGRTALAVYGCLCLDNSCCGAGSWNYIQVPGYLTEKLPAEKSESHFDIETISSEKERQEIRLDLSLQHPQAIIEIG